MMFTSFGHGINSAIDSEILTSAGIDYANLTFSDVSVFVLAGVGGLGILGYTYFRYVDDDMTEALDKITERQEENELRRNFRQSAMKRLAPEIALKKAKQDERDYLISEGYTAEEAESMTSAEQPENFTNPRK